MSIQEGFQLISNLSAQSWNKKGYFCPILLQTKRIDDSTKTKFRSAEKFENEPLSSPNLLSESPNLLLRSFTSKTISV